ncbi:MAG TPA: ADP-ribosylglycohydrolase family protein, partial [Planctomycetaceae bacterium]|nr:ADP-ribosylglycohydrolase family protein [Planctomycetaceae bacterium]
MLNERSKRARLSLDGLSIGDAFGQQFFYPGTVETATVENLPVSPWNFTDDTEMAIGIVQVLEAHGSIEQDVLAKIFASRHAVDPNRGYGAGARKLLRQIHGGMDWQTASTSLFGGSGSFGNGGAMRVAPLGAWFADDIDAVIEQASLSAKVTHSHNEGVVGTIAVALAAAWAWQRASASKHQPAAEMIPWVIERIDQSEVRKRL